MANSKRLIWDAEGERKYETGVDHVALYPMVGSAYPKGVAWNGIVGITENPSGAEANPVYADNIKYLNLISAEDYGVTLEALYSPEEFDECDGTASLTEGITIGQQSRKRFGLTYRTVIGNDADSNEYGYKIHLVYGCTASPSEKNYQTINDSPETLTMSWEIGTTPVDVKGHKPTSTLVINSTKVDKAKLEAFEEILYGSESADAKLPLPDEVLEFFKAA